MKRLAWNALRTRGFAYSLRGGKDAKTVLKISYAVVADTGLRLRQRWRSDLFGIFQGHLYSSRSVSEAFGCKMPASRYI
jgi:hypothetical protein